MRIINLLPQSEQDLLKKEEIIFTLRRGIFYSFISYALVLLILVGMRFYLQANLNDLGNQIQKQKEIISKQDNAAITKKVDFYNFSAADYNQLAANNPNWSKVLEEFAARVPAGVSVKHFNANTASGKIEISGEAFTRAAVLQLRSNIIASSFFQGIDLPLDNLQKPANLPYHYKFQVVPGVLKASQ